MKILALEFSSSVRSVAVLETGGGLHAVRSRLSDGGSRHFRPLSLVNLALEKANVPRHEIEAIAIGLGPGSYTGIRSAIALAQGWQLGRGIRTVGVSSADALAAAAHRNGLAGRVGIVIDAQRNELYASVYQVTSHSWCVIEPLRLAGIDHVASGLIATPDGAAPAVDLLAGPDVKRWFPQGHQLFPQAEDVGFLAVQRDDSTPAENLEPIYLRETAFVKAPPSRIVP